MKVIFITREGYQLSGARVRCHGFAQQLNKYDVQTKVLSFADDLGASYAEAESEMSLAKKLKLNFSAARCLINEDKNSIFFLQRLNYHVLAPLIVHLLQKNKLIFDCDDWNIRENPKYYLGFFPSSKMEYAHRKLAKRAEFCIAASGFLKDYLEPFSKKTYYLPTGVDTNLFYPRPKPDLSGIVFSWTGTVYHQPMLDNLNFILSCFAELAGEFENIFMHFAGQGKYYDEFRRSAARSRFSQRIKVLPWVEPQDMPQFLSNTDIGLLPLVQDSFFNQAKSPTKMFEYMAMEKPVIASRIGEAKNIIIDGETGFLAADRGEFILKMKRLILDAQLRKAAGQNAGRQIRNKYSLDILGQELFAMLRGF
ncbi:MAG TPA: glycosyltransferase [Candidatus Omnitrophota bacterium]|nr:glycosyltransferase [Candidatus Omnitrophota bacterium]HPT39227.1 glycosyltransferase [Candidatus Omnitrophota bacterium]